MQLKKLWLALAKLDMCAGYFFHAWSASMSAVSVLTSWHMHHVHAHGHTCAGRGYNADGASVAIIIISINCQSIGLQSCTCALSACLCNVPCCAHWGIEMQPIS